MPAQDRKRSQLESYFVEHCIEEKLNTMLNELVTTRPTQPLSWLVHKMRSDGAKAGSVPAMGTVPQVGKAAGQAIGAEVESAWGYCLGFQSTASGAAAAPSGGKSGGKSAKPAKPAAAAKSAGELTLTIDSLGSGVILAIR